MSDDRSVIEVGKGVWGKRRRLPNIIEDKTERPFTPYKWDLIFTKMHRRRNEKLRQRAERKYGRRMK